MDKLDLEFIEKVKSTLFDIAFTEYEGRLVITLPFTDYCGEKISISAFVMEDRIEIDDVGQVAGMLFGLDQHSEDTPAYGLVKNLTESYGFTMDYENGLLKQEITKPENIKEFVDFLKSIVSLQVVVPELKQNKPKGKRHPLAARIGRDIRKLNPPFYLDHYSKLIGKNDIWTVQYHYHMGIATQKDVVIHTADLFTKEPKVQAYKTIAMALDFMERNDKIDLRIVYELNGNATIDDVKTTVNLIESHKNDFMFETYNYADELQRGRFIDRAKNDIKEYQQKV